VRVAVAARISRATRRLRRTTDRVDDGRIVVVDDRRPLVAHSDLLGDATRREVVGMNDRDKPCETKASER
jgi:hypothetical protein